MARMRGVLSGLACLLTLCAGLVSPAHATQHTTYFITNAQGTVVATADSQGNVTYTAAYRPYGKQQVGAPQPGPGYTGHVNDSDTGLVYMQARYYDPIVGRFLSIDPIGPVAGNLSNFNRYDYASNNPMINIDPNGKSPMTREEAERLARQLNTRPDGSSTGKWSVSHRPGSGLNGYSPQMSNQAAMEASGLGKQQEENNSAKSPSYSKAVCLLPSVAAALTIGEVESHPKDSIASVASTTSDAWDKAGKILSASPDKFISDLGSKMGRTNIYVKILAAVPAAIKNQKNCVKYEEKDFIHREITQDYQLNTND